MYAALPCLTFLAAICFISGSTEFMPYSKYYKRYNNLDDQDYDQASLMRVFKRGHSDRSDTDENVEIPDRRVLVRIVKRQQKKSKKQPDEVVVIPFSTLFPHN